MSTNVQNSEAELSASKGMAVALIGPNDAHRKVVARALASSQGRKVHEFIDYPGSLNDLPRMLEQNFDVVLVDVDTDESYALQIIEKVAEMGCSVMAYSARTDQDLLMSCMRAGARDFLPLPTESNVAEPTRSVSPAPKHVAVAPQPAAPKTAPVTTVRSNVTPIVPEKRTEAPAEAWPTRVQEERRQVSQVEESPKASVAPEVTKSEQAGTEFAEWDAMNLRRAQAPPVVRPESRPRPSIVPDVRKKNDAPPRVVPSEVTSVMPPMPSPPIERPPVATDLFRSSLSMNESEPDEEAEKQGARWIKWVLIAAGPLVLALVLLVVLTRPSAQHAAKTSAPSETATTAQSRSESEGQLITNSTGKPASGSASKPSAGTDNATEAAQTTPGKAAVSADAMAAQLVAPSRIAGQIKNTPQVEEPPPSAPAPVSLEDSSAMPGAVFGNSKVKVAPHVVAISAGVADGMILHRTQPVYPKFAQDAHITGRVVLKATITKQGTIEGIQVISGPKILAPSAVDAVKTWKYRPYLLDNQPVSVETNVTVVFGSASR
jgi:TonB family protein